MNDFVLVVFVFSGFAFAGLFVATDVGCSSGFYYEALFDVKFSGAVPGCGSAELAGLQRRHTSEPCSDSEPQQFCFVFVHRRKKIFFMMNACQVKVHMTKF